MKGVRKIGIYSHDRKAKFEEKYTFEMGWYDSENSNLIDWAALLDGKASQSQRLENRKQLIPMQLLEEAEETPVEWSINTTKLWLFKGNVYISTKEIFSKEQIRLLILEEFDKEREYFERLMRKHAHGEKQESYVRVRIPESVRIEVWRRDGGKCVVCGGRENLEYDHIIPVSKGGSNTARNIELLCEKHNRSKGAKIG